jgi:glyoxylase-like metal-dependent hydrolase (beta-lactamase superfamily II)
MPSEQMPDITFDRAPVGPPGQLVSLTPRIRRMVAPNPGPMTFTGTCTYVVGHGDVAIIDPGPDLPDHVAALLAALAGECVGHIVVTHTHRDHCGAAARLKAATGATVVGCAPYIGAEASGGIDAAQDQTYRPDVVLTDGDRLEVGDLSLEAVETPGHTSNHICFALSEERALFSGDHVMAWSTSVVIPPDGSMAAYMASLAKLQLRSDAVYWPGHGGPVRAPQLYVADLIQHRRHREAAIVAALGRGASTLQALLAEVYPGLDPTLHGAARLSLLAHLEDLIARERAHSGAGPTPDARLYRLI